MSRDWAPFEHYLSEQWQIKQGYGSFWDITESLEIHLEGKEPERMYNDEEIALRRGFPFIGRFLFDDFPKLYGQLSEIEGGIDLLHAKDLELATFLEASKVTESGPNNFVLKVDDIGIDMDSYLMKWFTGKLDENFYYSERNNQLFIEAMFNEAKALNLFKDIKGQLENCENETSCGEPQAFVYLDNGRSIEVTLEQEDLEEEDYYYTVKLLCNETEFKNHDYNSTDGVIDQYCTDGNSIDEVVDLISTALACNEDYPVEEHSKVTLDEQISEAADKINCTKEATNKDKTSEQER